MDMQTAEIGAVEDVAENEAARMYNELVDRGEDPVDAAWLVDDHFGFAEDEPFSVYDDPFESDYEALAQERPITMRQDSEDAAESPAVQ